MLNNEIEIYSDKKLNLLAKCIYERIQKVEPTQYALRGLGIKQQVEALTQEYKRGLK